MDIRCKGAQEFGYSLYMGILIAAVSLQGIKATLVTQMVSNNP